MDARIRGLIPSDASAMVALRRQALADSPHAFLSSLEEDFASSEDGARDLLTQDGGIVFGAFTDHLVGMLGMYRAKPVKAAHKVHLWGTYVEPAARRRGIGERLLAAAIDHARSLEGVTAIRLSVSRPSEGAKRLYEKLGFRTWGAEPAAMNIDGDVVDELHMAMSLKAHGNQDVSDSTSPSSGTHRGTEVNHAAWIRNLMGRPAYERLTTELSGAELNSLLMAVLRERVRARTPVEVLRQFERDPFLPSRRGGPADCRRN